MSWIIALVIVHFVIGIGLAMDLMYYMDMNADNPYAEVGKVKAFVGISVFWGLFVLMVGILKLSYFLLDRGGIDIKIIPKKSVESITEEYFFSGISADVETFDKHRVVHQFNYRDVSTDPICGTTGNKVQGSRNPLKVTCKRCLALLCFELNMMNLRIERMRSTMMSKTKIGIIVIAIYVASVVANVLVYRYMNSSDSYKHSGFLLPSPAFQVLTTTIPIINTCNVVAAGITAFYNHLNHDDGIFQSILGIKKQ